jgi:hypothetical protein
MLTFPAVSASLSASSHLIGMNPEQGFTSHRWNLLDDAIHAKKTVSLLLSIIWVSRWRDLLNFIDKRF